MKDKEEARLHFERGCDSAYTDGNESEVSINLSVKATLWVGPFPSSLRKHDVPNSASHTAFISHTLTFYCHPINHFSHVGVCVCV